MDWREAGSDEEFVIDFKIDGEFVEPDQSSVTVTVRDAAGSVLHTAPLSGVTTSSTTYTVPASVNTLSGGAQTARRYITVKFTSGARPIRIDSVYGLRPFSPLTVSPATVRGLFGVRRVELPDEDVDIYQSYLDLKDIYSNLDAVMADRIRDVERLVALRCAIDLLPGMPLRALKQESLSNAEAIRQTIDWTAIGAQLLQGYAELAGDLDLVLIEEGAGISALFAIVTPTDPVTNA